MAKKKTADTSTPAAAPKPAPRRRTTPTSTAPESPTSVAADRAAAMPEPAGERVTPADSTLADSVTFVTAENVTFDQPGSPTFDQIAEAAYLRYLNRGASDGQDFEDWIEAERALRSGR
jgi:hypothetical protein